MRFPQKRSIEFRKIIIKNKTLKEGKSSFSHLDRLHYLRILSIGFMTLYLFRLYRLIESSIRIPINIQSHLLLSLWNGNISIGGSDYDGFTRLGWTEVLGQIYFDDEGLLFNGHFYILHQIISFLNRLS